MGDIYIMDNKKNKNPKKRVKKIKTIVSKEIILKVERNVILQI